VTTYAFVTLMLSDGKGGENSLKETRSGAVEIGQPMQLHRELHDWRQKNRVSFFRYLLFDLNKYYFFFEPQNKKIELALLKLSRTTPASPLSPQDLFFSLSIRSLALASPPGT